MDRASQECSPTQRGSWPILGHKYFCLSEMHGFLLKEKCIYAEYTLVYCSSSWKLIHRPQGMYGIAKIPYKKNMINL